MSEMDIPDPVEWAKEFAARCEAMAVELKTALLQIGPRIKEGKLTEGECCDIGYFMRQAERWLDECRKDAAARRKVIGEMLAIARTRATLSDPSLELTVRGLYSTGSPDVAQRLQVPKSGSAEYVEMLRALGVDPTLVEAGVFKLDFNGMSEYASAQAQIGKPIVPRGIKEFTEFTMTFRSRTRKDEERAES